MFYKFLLPLVAFSAAPRISTTISDTSKVAKVFLSAGLVSVFEFPAGITEVRVGDPKSVKVLISQVSPKELTVLLASSAARASNLIVRADKKIYVFDLIPSKSTHQDYVKIRSGYGAPAYTGVYEKDFQSVAIRPNPKRSIGEKTDSRVEVGP